MENAKCPQHQSEHATETTPLPTAARERKAQISSRLHNLGARRGRETAGVAVVLACPPARESSRGAVEEQLPMRFLTAGNINGSSRLHVLYVSH